jgi:hypothetical protein
MVEEDLDVYIEFSDQYGIRKVSSRDNLAELKTQSERAMNLAMGTIRSMAWRISTSIQEIEREIMPDEIEVEFSLKMDVEAGAVVPIIAKTTTGGQFTVKFKWEIERPKNVQLLVTEKNP